MPLLPLFPRLPPMPLQRLRRTLAALPQRGLLVLVRGYRLLLRPWVGNTCRFEPSCSTYALQALQQHGALRGTALTGWRILRCQPWCTGGCDPVPEHFNHPATGLFTRLGLTRPGASTRKLP